jgi:hypothetical protein
VFVGQPNEAGKEFDVVVIAADGSASNAPEKYLDRRNSAGLPRLPDGAFELHRVTVTRK